MPIRTSTFQHHQAQSTSSSTNQHTSTMSASSTTATSSTASGSGSSTSLNKSRQYAHLHAQLAQLNAHLADTENLVRMTAVQAQDMRFLGGFVGALFMGSARVLGEESVKGRGADGGAIPGAEGR